MSRISELRQRVQRRTMNLYDTLFTRRVSIFVTMALAPLGVTPNQVSAFGACVGAGACALMAFGSRDLLLVGVAMLHLYAILDSVDGELARLSARYSLAGLFIEDLSAYVMINAFNLAVAWRLYTDAHLAWPLVCAVLVTAFARNVMPVARRAILKSVLTRRPAKHVPDTSDAKRPSKVREFIYENVVHVTNQWMVISALLALFVHGAISVHVVLVFYASSLALFAVRELAGLALMLRNNRLERELSRVYAAASQAPEHDGQKLSEFSVV